MITVASGPIRTCVGCRARAPKDELVRIVRTHEGPRADPAATMPGRGAYVHPTRACVEEGLRGAVTRALRSGPGGDEVGRLMLDLERMGAV